MIPATGLSGFIARVLSNEARNSLTVRFATALLLSRFGIVGKWAGAVGFLIRGVLGVFMEEGILGLDVLLDAWREGAKLKEFQVLALEQYNKAKAKVYDEDKKNEIRKEYLKIIALIGNVGTAPKP